MRKLEPCYNARAPKRVSYDEMLRLMGGGAEPNPKSGSSSSLLLWCSGASYMFSSSSCTPRCIHIIILKNGGTLIIGRKLKLWSELNFEYNDRRKKIIPN